jgi:hypothetical protein
MITPATHPTSTLRELAERTGDGLTVRLLWHPPTGQLFLQVEDRRGDRDLLAPVAAPDGLFAFQHPYAYVEGGRPARDGAPVAAAELSAASN